MPSSTDSFVHLHVHTEYSMLDGAARLRDLFAEATRQGMPALAVTDHGNMFGAYDFYKGAKGAGIKPIIGVEAYLAPKIHRSERRRVRWGNGGDDDVSGGGAFTHMTMLAANNDGMHNLFRQQSIASIEGFYYKPRVDRELLNRYAKGVIATTGCPSGEVQTYLRMGRYQEALASAAEFRDIFEPGHFFVELMDHGLDIERRVQADLIRLAKDLGLPLVATNDLHYTFPHEAEAHDALLCVQSGSQIADPKRFKFDGTGYYLKSAAEMRSLWGELPEACDNTLLIAEMCDISFNEGVGSLMPRFPVPDGETEESWFVKEVAAGLARRYPDGVPEDRQRQADYEVDVIRRMGFPSYFLVTSDFINWAKRNGIRVGPGRGSGAGSIVAYAMGITELDPMEHGLLFERFLNPDRVSMPDFDVDFDDRRRGEVIEYVTQKYGSDRVAQIVTMGKIKAKAAVKDASRILGYPFGVGDRINKAMPPDVMGKGVPLSGMFDPNHPRYAEAGDFRALFESDSDVRKVVETAKGLEGLTRQWGVHAAGVIMSAEPLIDHIPVMRRDSDGAIITQFEYPICEGLGMLKFDFLGLSNLTIIDDAIRNIKANRGIDVDLDNLSLDDAQTFELLARGETSGVFQLEGGGMRSLLRAMKPEHFEHISAVLALYRPGPMGANAHIDYADRKNGRKPVVPIHPELAEPLADILGDTYGLIVYQEQVMAIAQKLAGYSLGKADLLRRAMGKKKKEILDKEFVPFADGMRANGYSDEAIRTLWDILVPFSDYAFNKSHTAAYGLISYWTAYLKAHYPAEYMAALLTSNADNKGKTAIFLNECRRMGIEVLSPDVNESVAEYAAVGDSIRVGMAAIRNVGVNVVAAIVRSREEKGRFADFPDFLAKVEPVACNKKVVESLVKAGAFDSLGHTRRALLSIHEDAVDQYTVTKKQEAIGQDDLFGGMADEVMGGASVRVPDIEEWDKRTLLADEKDMLGLYVSDHPLNGIADALAAQADTPIVDLLESERSDYTVTIGGLVTGLARKITKNGEAWAIVTLEDLDAAIEVLVFPRTYKEVEALLATDAILLITGDVKRNDDGSPKIFASAAKVPMLAADGSKPVVLTLPANRVNTATVGRLVEVLEPHKGLSTVHLRVVGSGKTVTVALSEQYRVTASAALMGDLKQAFGPGITGSPAVTG